MNNNLDRKITRDDIALMNGVCAGRSLDFTTEFMRCIPQIIDIANCIGWVKDGIPDVKSGGYEVFNGAIRWNEREKASVISSLAYLNQYPLYVDEWPELVEYGHKVEEINGDIVYTGWAYKQVVSGGDLKPYFEMMHDWQIEAWKALPVYTGSN